jgi:WD40 repeat protein
LWICGGEDKIIRIYDFEGNLVKEWPSDHSLRIKDIATLEDILVTCSSDGTIHSWDLKTFELIQKYNCKTRLTCVKICKASKPKEKEVKEEEYPESEFEDVIPKKRQKITVSIEENGKKKVTKRIRKQ